MSRSISLTDLLTYSAFTSAIALLLVDWVGEWNAPLQATAVVLAVFAHHLWSRTAARRAVDEAVSRLVVEQHLREVGDGVRRLTRQ